jgi:hypothetical protein
LTAVRNVLIQASLAELKANGYYERYTKLVTPRVQTVKAGPKEMVLEEWGFVLNRYPYYRHGHIAALDATYTVLGARLTDTKVVSYSAVRDELVVRVGWT